MRKLIALSALALAAFAAMPAVADGIQTDQDCARSGTAAPTGQPPSLTPHIAPMATDEQGVPELLRGSACVSDGNADNGAELYIGGEIGTESNESFACGAIEVMGFQGTGLAPAQEELVFGYEDWGGSDCQ